MIHYDGFAKISNVEFDRPGKNRYAGISFVDRTENETSYVKHSSFHHGLGSSIRLENSQGIVIENNVLHRSLNYGIKIIGGVNRVRNNLITLNQWASTYRILNANLDYTYSAAIDASMSKSVVLEGNFIAGAERIGIQFQSLECDQTNSVIGNTVYGASSGVVILPDYADIKCFKVTGFTIFKSSHYGIYYQGSAELSATENILVDNQINIFTIVIQPGALTHEAAEKKVFIENSLIVGQSEAFDCLKDTKPNGLSESKSVMDSFGAGLSRSGKIGIVWPNFIGLTNRAPMYSW